MGGVRNVRPRNARNSRWGFPGIRPEIRQGGKLRDRTIALWVHFSVFSRPESYRFDTSAFKAFSKHVYQWKSHQNLNLWSWIDKFVHLLIPKLPNIVKNSILKQPCEVQFVHFHRNNGFSSHQFCVLEICVGDVWVNWTTDIKHVKWNHERFGVGCQPILFLILLQQRYKMIRMGSVGCGVNGSGGGHKVWIWDFFARKCHRFGFELMRLTSCVVYNEEIVFSAWTNTPRPRFLIFQNVWKRVYAR